MFPNVVIQIRQKYCLFWLKGRYIFGSGKQELPAEEAMVSIGCEHLTLWTFKTQ